MTIRAKILISGIGLALSTGVTVAEERLQFSSELSAGAVYALTSMMISSGSSELDFVSASADFNDDGKSDVIAFAQSSYFCGSGGCGPVMFLSTKKGWREVDFLGLEMPENWYLLDSRANGFRKIAVLAADTETIYEWNGEAYAQVK